MKKILYILIPLVLIGLVVAKLLTNKQIAEERVYLYDREQPVQVTAMRVKQASLQPEYSFTGTLDPNRESKLSAEIQGKVNRILVEEGATVRKGQVLIQLDDTLLQLQLKAAEVQVKGLEADLKRYRVLVENEAIQGIQLEKTELALETAQVQVSTLKEQINKSQIRAPFDGIITAQLTEEGDFAAPGKPLLQLTDIRQLKLGIQVPEKDLKLFELGKVYTVSIPAIPVEINGKVNLIGSRGNPANSFPVEIIVSNLSKKEIKAGMFGKLILKDNTEITGILIPSAAILGSDLEPQVYIVNEGKAMIRNIQIEKRMQDQVIVRSGLKENEVVIIGGLINVFEGASVITNL
ncbi:RND family efflux transporter, MFP subunit [Aquiflexum balticum DSM 16537]|uniref:RND family efflux transporter, MFP subunit n=1 Tax=Aquiflexum balticum DSM 16537 TaxID=758820 RepID=A0A1W2HBC0_9BACT|nr:efflux RND transporter periplasmic adaptor subunit [Aquiflexum balticum]SMD46022.1 RND family efflux transporter, MFP subunit [Aquiflexum balticum DSM 16537]